MNARPDTAPRESFESGLAAHRRGDFPRAEQIYRSIIARNPRHFDALHMLGTLALQGRHLPEAAALLRQALAVKPNAAAAHGNLGVCLREMGEFQSALDSLDRAVALNPRHADAWSNRGNALKILYRLDEAIASHDRAIAIDPTHAPALANRAAILRETGRWREAEENLNRALRLSPNDAKALWLRADLALLQGRYEEGWRLFETRKMVGKPSKMRESRHPEWDGSTDLNGKTIFLYADGGFGDTIQFCRYVPLVQARGARVILGVQDPLIALMRSSFPDVEVVAAGVDLGAFDCQAALLSLPLAFQTTVSTIPAFPRYLRPDPARLARWRTRAADCSGRKTGLVWTSGMTAGWWPGHNPLRDLRSVPIAALAPLAGLPGTRFISLQKPDIPLPESASEPPPGLILHDWTDEIADFADTAALIETLDLVITVDTSVAHLAGALGKPVWILTRFGACWRWLLDRTDSPWYPSARLFRNRHLHDWTTVIAEVTEAAKTLPYA